MSENNIILDTERIDTVIKISTSKIPSYTLKAIKTYYNKIKDNPEFKIKKITNANTWISNNREKHNQNQKLYREIKKAKFLEAKKE